MTAEAMLRTASGLSSLWDGCLAATGKACLLLHLTDVEKALALAEEAKKLRRLWPAVGLKIVWRSILAYSSVYSVWDNWGIKWQL